MSLTWTSRFLGLTVPTIVPIIHLTPFPKLNAKKTPLGSVFSVQGMAGQGNLEIS